MILDVHADIVHGKKRSVLLDVAKGAEAAGIKVNIKRCNEIDTENFSLLWRQPNKNDTALQRIIEEKGYDKIFFINNNYFNNYIHRNNYRRLTYKSIYDNEAVYPIKGEQDKKSFYADHNLNIKDWVKNGTHVIIFPNNSLTFGSKGQNVQKWLSDNINKCLDAGITNIIVKPHPTEPHFLLSKEDAQKVIIDNNNIFNLIKKYHIKFALIYNSGAATACLLEGIPTFIQGPNNLARKFSNIKDWSNVHDANYNVDRQEYIDEASEKLWLFDDIKNGKPWKKLLEQI